MKKNHDRSTYPSEHAYVFYPKAASQQYGVLCDLLRDPELAFIGVSNVRNVESLVRLMRWQDHIVLQRLLWPEDLNETVDVPVKYEDSFMEGMSEFVRRSIVGFDPDMYRNVKKQRIESLVAGGDMAAVPGVKKLSEDERALEALKSLLATKEA